MRESDAVLSCLSDRPEHFSYRMRLLNSSWSRRTKLAHAPGMTLEILAAADTDYDAIAERAVVPLSAVLVLGRRLDLVTEDSRGQEYRLTVAIGGWNYPPGVSDGVIRDGTWA